MWAPDPHLAALCLSDKLCKSHTPQQQAACLEAHRQAAEDALTNCCSGRTGLAGSRRQSAASLQERAQLAPPLQIPDLNFTVDQFFCVGRAPCGNPLWCHERLYLETRSAPRHSFCALFAFEKYVDQAR